MTFEEYKQQNVRHVILPSTEGCASGPLEFDIAFPPAAVVDPLVNLFRKKIQEIGEEDTPGSRDAKSKALTSMFVGILQASRWPDEFSFEDIGTLDDLAYLVREAMGFFGIGGETQMKDGDSQAPSLTMSEPSSGRDSSNQETSPPTV
jgi:hypothetical protein